MTHRNHSKTRVILTWIISLVIALGVGLPVYFTSPNLDLSKLDLTALSNASFFPAALLLGLAALNLLSRAGTFDIAAYSFAAIGARFRPRELRRYEDAYDYKVKADERRRSKGGYILPYLIVGEILMIIAIVSSIILKSQVG